MRIARAGIITIVSNRVPAYEVPLAVCLRALRAKQLEDDTGVHDRHATMAAKLRVARTTLSRFFNGGPVSLVTARIILAGLGLRFEDVATPIEPLAAAS